MKTLMHLLLLFIAALLTACDTTSSPGGSLTIDPIAGICARSADGKYAACYNPLTKGYTLKATVPGGLVKELAYDSATKTWRGTLPDGSTAVYGQHGLTFEPALPTPAK